MSKGEILTQVEIANRFPRNVTKFQAELEKLATSSLEVATSCFYKLKRKGKEGTVIIEGPSIRFMELAAPLWKNLRWAGRVAGIEEDAILAQGVAFDTQANLWVSIEVRRSILTRDGRRFSADMVNTTAMAGISIALRNALGHAIPRPYWQAAFLKAKEKAVGTKRSLAERRQMCIAEYGKMGVSLEEILKFIEKPELKDITLDDLETLLGTFNAIREGTQSVDEAFGRTPPAPAEPTGKPRPAPTPGGPLEAALAGTQAQATAPPAQGPKFNGVDPTVPGSDKMAIHPPAPAAAPNGTRFIPQNRSAIITEIDELYVSRKVPIAHQSQLWTKFVGRATPENAQIGKLQQLLIHLRGMKES